MRYPTRVVGTTAQTMNARIDSAIACKLVGVVGYNNGPATFVMVFNQTTVPSGGANGAFCIACAANSNFALALPDAIDMDGVVLVVSSTSDILTATATFVAAQTILAG